MLSGRILADTLHNYAGATLVADFGVQGKELSLWNTEVVPTVENYIDDEDSYWNTVYPSRALVTFAASYYLGDNPIDQVAPYFYVQNAILENGSILVLKPVDSFGLQPRETENIRLLYSANGQLNIDNLILRLETETPLLEISWSDLSDQNNLIVAAHFLEPQEAGLSPNATRSVYAALTSGVFTFDSNPEEWIPDVSGALLTGAAAAMRHTFGNLQTRIHGLSGANSGDEAIISQGLWYEGGYSDADQKRRSSISGFNADTVHFSLGYDVERDNALLGLAYTHSSTNLQSNDNRQDMDSTDHLFSVYARYDFYSFFMQGVATYGHGNINSLRTIGSELLESGIGSRLYAVSSQIGIETLLNAWHFTPVISLEYNKQHFNSYDESGGSLALAVNSQDYEIFNIGGGLTCDRNWIMGWGTITPEVKAMIYYDVIGARMQAVSHFVGGQNSFVSNGSDPAQTSWELSPSVTMRSAGEYPMSFKFSYAYTGKNDFEANSISGELRFDF